MGRFVRLAQLALAVAAAFAGASPLCAQGNPTQYIFANSSDPNVSPGIAVFKLDPSTGTFAVIPGSPFSTRATATAFAVNPAAKFLFAATGNAISVYAVNQVSGVPTEVPNSPFASGSGITPLYLSVDPTGRFLFVLNKSATANAAAGEIDVYDINSVTGALTPSPNSLSPATATQTVGLPHGLFVHPSGKWLYMTGGTFIQSLIQQYQIDPATGDLTLETSVQDGSNPESLAGDPRGQFIFGGHGQMVGFIDGYKISPADGSLTSYATFNGTFSSGQGVFPLHMAVDSSGSFLYTDLGSFVIPVNPGALVPINPITAFSTPHGQPWVADLIGPFVLTPSFDSNGVLVGLASLKIDSASGQLTPAAGSPFAAFPPFVVSGYPAQFTAPGVGFNPPGGLSFPGTLVGTPSAPQPVQLTNTGFASLTVGAISITGANSADFSQINNCPATLSPGAVCTFNVTFTPSAASTRNASLTIADNAAGSPHSANLSGSGNSPAPAVTLLPGSLTFASTFTGATSPTQPVTLTNSGTGVLHITSIGLAGPNPGDFTQANNCGATLAVSASCTFTVAFQPQAVGVRTANITVVDDAANPTQIIGLSGTGAAGVPAVTLAPASFTFPAAMVSATGASQNFTVTNSGTATLHLSSIALGGPNAGDFTQTNTCGATVAVGANCAIAVTFKPQAIGTRTANVTVTDDAANSPQSIALSGTGAAPFSVAPVSNSMTLVPGQSTQLAMQFTSLPNFSGTVLFTCSGAPAGSTCAVSPSSLPITTQTTTLLTLMVNSTTSSAIVRPDSDLRLRKLFSPSASLFVLAGLFLPLAFLRRRPFAHHLNFATLRFGRFAMLLALSAGLVISACGGAGGTLTPPSGPAAGSYTLTIVAASGNVSVATNITLNVQ